MRFGLFIELQNPGLRPCDMSPAPLMAAVDTSALPEADGAPSG
ncbi:MAG: hypothetical protein ACE5IZ_07175 [Dehalococcoidia bacterium]